MLERETHAHADHLTASQYLKSKLPGHPPICIGSRITQVQSNFAPFYGFDKSILAETFDIFLQDEESFPVGDLSCKVIHLPGHTPDHIGYIIGTAVFTGDSIFMVSEWWHVNPNNSMNKGNPNFCSPMLDPLALIFPEEMRANSTLCVFALVQAREVSMSTLFLVHATSSLTSR